MSNQRLPAVRVSEGGLNDPAYWTHDERARGKLNAELTPGPPPLVPNQRHPAGASDPPAVVLFVYYFRGRLWRQQAQKCISEPPISSRPTLPLRVEPSANSVAAATSGSPRSRGTSGASLKVHVREQGPRQSNQINASPPPRWWRLSCHWRLFQRGLLVGAILAMTRARHPGPLPCLCCLHPEGPRSHRIKFRR